MAIPEKPISRIEHYLARANGQNVQPPEPISRIEHYLNGIAGGVPQELLDDVANLKSQINEKATAIMQTVTNQAVASFADGADDMPLKSLVVAINPVQEGAGDPSPENVRPITGWNSVTVTVNGTDYTTDLGQTVYGGTLDVVSGVLTVDRAMMDLGALNWNNEDDTNPGQARASEGVAGLGAVYQQTPICSVLKGTTPRSFAQMVEGTVCFSNSESTPFIRVRSISYYGLTDAEIKTALTGVQFCYTLATPQTYQLTPVEVKTLLGQNNIFADTGNVTAIYPADTKTYIDDKIAALQALVLENISNS